MTRSSCWYQVQGYLSRSRSNIKVTIFKKWPLCFTNSGRSRLNSFPNKPLFSRVCRTSLLKTLWEKEKLLVTSNFSFSHSVFYPFGYTFLYFYHTSNCRLQSLSVWQSLKFVFLERVNDALSKDIT